MSYTDKRTMHLSFSKPLVIAILVDTNINYTKTTMKSLIVILFLLPSLVFGQQFLWSTAQEGELKDNDVTLIPIENVTDRVLSYYDFYEYYNDLSGFSKDGFEEFLKIDLKTANSIQWNSKMAYEEPTAFAFKGNDGRGSFVVILFLQKDNIDLIVFSNDIGQGSISANYGGRGKFVNWLHSFWKYGEKRGTALILEDRRFVVTPHIEDDGKQSDKIAVEIRADREGKIISARAGVRGTTISNNALYEKCERAALEAQLSRHDKAPPIQTGVIVFNFKMK